MRVCVYVSVCVCVCVCVCQSADAGSGRESAERSPCGAGPSAAAGLSGSVLQ